VSDPFASAGQRVGRFLGVPEAMTGHRQEEPVEGVLPPWPFLRIDASRAAIASLCLPARTSTAPRVFLSSASSGSCFTADSIARASGLQSARASGPIAQAQATGSTKPGRPSWPNREKSAAQPAR
jgi:hypothetical protein